MVNPASFERTQTIALDAPPVNNRKLCICVHCDDAHKRYPNEAPLPEPMQSRREKIQGHLRRCRWYNDAVAQGSVPSLDQGIADWQEKRQSGRHGGRSTLESFLQKRPSSAPYASSRLSSDISSSASSEKRHQRSIDTYFVPFFSEQKHAEFERLLVEFQAENFLPSSFVERASTKRLFKFLNVATIRALPDRHALAGKLLDDQSSVGGQASRDALFRRQQSLGGRVNLLSDVWQNVAKKHLLGCHLTLFGAVVNYGLYPTASRHDGIAIAQQLEGVILAAHDDQWTIGAIVTDNAGQCGRARRILAPRWPRIAFLHCFAHDINNLVKAVLRTSFSTITKKASSVVTALNASSSKWLPLVKNEIIATYGQPLSFISLCETRWNSMQGCFASLLRVKTALVSFAMKYQGDPEFPASARVFFVSDESGEDKFFWEDLTAAEKIIHPLAYASYKLQCDENSLADVVTCYRLIYAGFASHPHIFDLEPLIEHRWRQCEQPLMLLALFLHPMHVLLAKALVEDEDSALKFERLCEYGVYYYRRFLSEDTDGLRGDMLSWYKREFIRTKLSDVNNDVAMFWDFARTARPGSKLPKLATTVLSICVNTATCERYFSELAAIHTAKRNRLDPDNAHKYSLIRRRMRETYTEESGTVTPKVKKVVNPHERTMISDPTPAFGTSEDDMDVAQVASEQPREDTLDYWQAVLDVLSSDADPEEDEELADNDELPRVICNGSEEDPIPSPNLIAFPDRNMPNFPQESELQGIRGDKYPLMLLFPQTTLGVYPYVEALTP